MKVVSGMYELGAGCLPASWLCSAELLQGPAARGPGVLPAGMALVRALLQLKNDTSPCQGVAHKDMG